MALHTALGRAREQRELRWVTDALTDRLQHVSGGSKVSACEEVTLQHARDGQAQLQQEARGLQESANRALQQAR